MNEHFAATRSILVERLIPHPPDPRGMRVRREHPDFGPRNESAFEAMSSGWPRELERVEEVSAAA